MPSTLKDIGHELGLSAATVSRALNGFPEVGRATRLRVLEAAGRLNYMPNQVARKLVTGRSDTVGLIVHRSQQLAADSTFFNVVGGISAALADRQVDLLLHVAADDDPVAPYRRLIAKGSLDGFILNAPRKDDARIAYLTAEGAHFVVHGRSNRDAPYPYYDVDNHQVSRIAVDLLCDLGHSDIALLNGPSGLAFADDRRHGFEQALMERGIRPDPSWLHSGPMTESFGYAATMRLVNSPDGRPSAIVCCSTLVARGAFRAVRDKGLRIPEDISIVAHDDDVPVAPYSGFDPVLTVTRSPLTDACEPLADILLLVIAGRSSQGVTQRVATPELLVGGSVGPADRVID